MTAIRWILGRLILLIDALTTPKGIVRGEEEQASIERQTAHLSLYQFKACPFCVKVRRAMKRYSLNIDTRDAKLNEQYRQELLTQGGAIKVPCLRVEDDKGGVEWLYESNHIIEYLEQRFAPAPTHNS